jgi:hypothetical protein
MRPETTITRVQGLLESGMSHVKLVMPPTIKKNGIAFEYKDLTPPRAVKLATLVQRKYTGVVRMPNST